MLESWARVGGFNQPRSEQVHHVGLTSRGQTWGQLTVTANLEGNGSNSIIWNSLNVFYVNGTRRRISRPSPLKNLT